MTYLCRKGIFLIGLKHQSVRAFELALFIFAGNVNERKGKKEIQDQLKLDGQRRCYAAHRVGPKLSFRSLVEFHYFPSPSQGYFRGLLRPQA